MALNVGRGHSTSRLDSDDNVRSYHPHGRVLDVLSKQKSFNGIESGSYFVELVGENGKILAIGDAFTVAPGDSVATFVRLGTKVPWFNGVFRNAASAVSAPAASIGITALAPEAIRCVSNCG